MCGTSTPHRELLHFDDLAVACLFLMENYDSTEPINGGCGEDISNAELARLMEWWCGFRAD